MINFMDPNQFKNGLNQYTQYSSMGGGAMTGSAIGGSMSNFNQPSPSASHNWGPFAGPNMNQQVPQAMSPAQPYPWMNPGMNLGGGQPPMNDFPIKVPSAGTDDNPMRYLLGSGQPKMRMY